MDGPYAVEALCQMAGVVIEENLHKALVLMGQGLNLGDICRMELLNDYEPQVFDEEDRDQGRLSAFNDVWTLLSTADGGALIRPVLQSDIFNTIRSEDKSFVIEALKIYVARVVRDFSMEIRRAYPVTSPDTGNRNLPVLSRERLSMWWKRRMNT